MGHVGSVATLAVVALLLSAGASPRAETLSEVLAEAYASNPVLNSARHAIAASNRSIERAATGLNARVDAFTDAGIAWDRDLPSSTETRLPASIGLLATLPVYDGSRTEYSVRAAESRASSSRSAFVGRVQSVLIETVMAYATVVQQDAVVAARRHLVELVARQLSVIKGELAIGQASPVEHASIMARLGRAKAELSSAEASLRTASADFKRLVGRLPGRLEDPRPAGFGVPKDLGTLLASLEDEHPAILAAHAELAAAEAEIGIARSDLLPRFNIEGELKHQTEPDNDSEQQSVASVIARLTVPLVESGEIRARIGETTETSMQRRFDLDAVRVQVVQQVTAAWSTLIAERAEVAAAGERKRSASLAEETVKAEYDAGQATPRDLLDAEDELLEAEIARLTARRNEVVAAYTLLAAAGQLDSKVLGAGRERTAAAEEGWQVSAAADDSISWQATVKRIAPGPRSQKTVPRMRHRKSTAPLGLRSSLL